jgi:hypothetical protein
MTIDEFIARLQAQNTGAKRHVLIQDSQGRFWTPDFENSRIRTSGDEPYEYDDDGMHQLVICLPAEAEGED